MALNTEGDEREIIYKLQRSFKVSSRVYEVDDNILVSPVSYECSTVQYVCSESDDVFDQFEAFERFILQWESNMAKPKSLDDCFDDAKKYLSVVDSNFHLVDDQVVLSDKEFSARAGDLKKTVMLRLRDVFHHVLITDSVPLDANQLCACEGFCRLLPRVTVSSVSDGSEDSEYESSLDDDSDEERRDSPEVLYMNLVNSDAICVLNSIAERMIRAGYEKECREVYISARCDALREYLSILGVDSFGITEVQKLDWDSLDEAMKDWIQAIRVVTNFLLFAEKQLCDQVFGGSEQFKKVCFWEIATECMTQLLNHGQNVVSVQQSPEKLFRILDMHSALTNAQLDLKALFSQDSSDFFCNVAERTLSALGEAAKGAYIKFEIEVKSDTSRKVTCDADTHPFVRTVVKYIITLVADYGATLNFLLENNADGSGSDALTLQSLLGRRLLELISSLESNIKDKSKLYTDDAMQYIFLVNNIFYMAQEVKGSKLGNLLGDDWMRERRKQVRKYANCYLRTCWSKVVAHVKEEGLVTSGSSTKVCKEALKTRFKDFNAAFEAIYKSQTGWKVPDPQLRDELRVLISESVIRAYCSFLGRFKISLESEKHAEKYLKYTGDDMELYMSDLFEGAPKRLHDSLS